MVLGPTAVFLAFWKNLQRSYLYTCYGCYSTFLASKILSMEKEKTLSKTSGYISQKPKSTVKIQSKNN